MSFGIALFLTELAPNWLKRPLGIAIGVISRYSKYRLWYVGTLYLCAALATYFQEPVGNVLSSVPIVGELFSGPAFGIGILAAGGYPRNYDHPLYRVCNA